MVGSVATPHEDLTGADPEAPEVSVVIPTRDRRHLLETTLAAALNQRDVDHEVIVVDDGSGDGTAARLAAIGDPRLRVLRNGASQGVSAARNRAIAEARAPWVAFLDDDDVWSPDFLRHQLAAVSGTGAVISYCDSLVLDHHMRLVGVSVPPEPEELPAALQSWNFIGGPSVVLARSDALRLLGGFDEELSLMADWDLWMRLIDHGAAVHCHEALAGYVVHAGGMYSQHPEAAEADFALVAAKHADRAAAIGRHPERAILALTLAHAHARAGRRRAAARTALGAGLRHGRPRLVALGFVLLDPRGLALKLHQRFKQRKLPPTPEWLEAHARRALPSGSPSGESMALPA
jgi:GT2 family glycosyltransferase